MDESEIVVHDIRTSDGEKVTPVVPGFTQAVTESSRPGKSLGCDVEMLHSLAHGVLELEGVLNDAPGPLYLEIWLADEDGMSELNALHMGRSGPTDVLSFPVDGHPPARRRQAVESMDMKSSGLRGSAGAPRPPGIPWLLGDVVICPLQAEANATRNGVDPEYEIALLVVHGILHLLGMDHETEEEAEVMEGRERDLLSKLWRPSPSPSSATR
ncbi:MAG: rRNA maturation RNase YbeY [Actinobacteria bacterium]|nr:rRNA maturation RNase YbeY [Actinomycetota bacterium]MCL5446045.1 rRNA maturation RNase YbeY [Actinomycetota bacterium]